MPDVTQYINTFSGSVNPFYVIEKGQTEWVPITTSVREIDDISFNELIEQDYKEIIPLSINLDTGSVTADFIAANRQVAIGSTVEFTNQSVGDIVSYKWYFGDGQISTQENPLHFYNQSGSYSVKLEITGSMGAVDVYEQEDYISVYYSSTQTPSEKVDVIDTKEGGNVELKWNNNLVYNLCDGSFTVECLFKMETPIDSQPATYPMIFDAGQRGYYTTDFPYMFKKINEDELRLYNLPITWYCKRGFTIGLSKSLKRLYFNVNLSHELPDDNNSLFGFNSLWFDNNEIQNEFQIYPWALPTSSVPYVPPETNIRPDISNTSFLEFATGSFTPNIENTPYSIDDGPNFESWYYYNVSNNNPDITFSKNIYSTEELKTNHWYYVCCIYKREYVSSTSTAIQRKLKLFIKDITENRWLVEPSDVVVENDIIKPKLQTIGTTQTLSSNLPWGTWVHVSGSVGNFSYNSTDYHSLLFPVELIDNYIDQNPVLSQKVKFPGKSPNNNFYGKIKYARTWMGGYSDNREMLEPYILEYNLNNTPHSSSIYGKGWWEMNEGSGESIFDQSGNAMKAVFKSGSDETEVVTWKEDSIP